MTDPDRLPDGEGGLHLERTALAWRRLSLVLLGVSLVSARVLWLRFDAWALLPTLATGGVATIMLFESQRHYRAQVNRSTTTPPDGRLPLFAAAAATGTAVLWLLVIATAR